MSGLRLDRLLTSTAVLLLLTAAAGSALADPKDMATSNVATSDVTQSVSATARPTANDPSAAGAPAAAVQKPDQPAAAPATAATPATAPAPTTASSPAETAAPAAAAGTAPPASAPASTTATAPAETAAPAAASTAAAAPTDPVADQLHNLADSKFDQIFGNKQLRSQVDAFYSGRNYAPIWITNGKANERANAAIAYLSHVDADGLNPADYPVPNFASISDPAALANAEMQLTASVLTYVHHAAVGRVHWSRVSPDIEFNEKVPEPADVLAGIVSATDVAAALDAYEPQTPGYKALKAKYAEVRAGKMQKQADKIGSGPVLKAGMQDDRVPALRERLNVLGDDGTTYDKTVAEAVRKFQREHQLAATGTLTAATVEALNGKTPDHAADIIQANLERWRWMPHHLPDTYVMVNLPDFTLRVMHDNRMVWTTRIVIGKPDKPTPLMTAEMKYITINPTWNVPPSIVNNEYLPALAQDPTVLDRMGLKIGRNPDGSVHIWQPPGDKNALGRIRFNFPNKFLVYQHDTPDKYLFAYEKRAYSHGCMRVQNPQHYAEVLLSLVRPNDGYSEERIRKMIAEGSETDIQFPNFVQVDLTYQTAFVDDQGKLEFRDDVYGRDKALIALLKSDDKFADIPVEHKEDISRREVLAMPDQPSLFGGNRGLFGGRSNSYSGGGDNFFSRLFGGFAADPAPPVPHKPIPHGRKVSRAGDTTVSR
ncbi:MAG TPA: L,D-transpeptidase family protein [Xanthobacteraceae bacterium]|nr:L,D-transpeptidase family protein [Xanthobacteraceae bacterium]